MGLVRTISEGTKKIIHKTTKTGKKMIHLLDTASDIGAKTLPVITAVQPELAEVTVPVMGGISGYNAIKNQLGID